MRKEFAFENDHEMIYDYLLTIDKCELKHAIKNPVLEIVLKNDIESYTNKHIFNLFTFIGYFKDGNDVDDKITDCKLIEKIYERFDLSIKKNGRSIYFELPYVSLIYGLNANRVETNLKFYLKLNNASEIYSNISQLNLSLNFDPFDDKFLINFLTETLSAENEKETIRTSDSVFIIETM
jgi:hypothetical protein